MKDSEQLRDIGNQYNRMGKGYHFWRSINNYKKYNDAIEKWVNALDLVKWNRVLDIATWPWYNLSAIQNHIWDGWSIIAIDYSTTMLDLATILCQKNNRDNVSLIQQDAATIDYDKEFDAAMVTLWLSVIPDRKATLQKMIIAVKDWWKITIIDSNLPACSRRLLRPLVNYLHKVMRAKERDIISYASGLLSDVKIEKYMWDMYFILTGTVKK